MRHRRRLTSTTTLSAATALAALGMLTEAMSAPAALARGGQNELSFTVTDGGGPGTDGTYTVRCRPTGGDHPDPASACAALDEAGRGGRNPFAPVPKDEQCTMIYGGRATAHVTGVWHGRPVDARFTRSDGCQIERWDRLVPALPKVS